MLLAENSAVQCDLAFSLWISDYNEMLGLTVASRWGPTPGFQHISKSLFGNSIFLEFSNTPSVNDDLFEFRLRSTPPQSIMKHQLKNRSLSESTMTGQ